MATGYPKPVERYRVGLELLGSIENQKVLDAGCGFGTLQPHLPDAMGVDRHWTNLQRGLASLGESFQDRLVASNLENIPFPDQLFDAIILLETLEHVDNEEVVLEEMARVLKKGGRFVLSVPHHRLIYNIIDLEHWFVPLITKRAVHRHYRKKKLQKMLEEKGFRVDACLERGMLIAACMRWFYLPFDLTDYFFTGGFQGPMGKSIRKIFDRCVDWEFGIPTFFGGSLFVVAHKEI
ncbi:MAG: class I SAM-dependent methyltransferase [Deltaproteobacteria bacterium]|nr:class I SAM-dependent methyltransferase [Deltaproteobacteria bacterium]